MNPRNSRLINAAYDHCQNIVKSHYENFPVASLALPKKLRRPISAIYAFARAADDFADEGDLDPAERLQKLQKFDEKLHEISNSNPKDPVFIALADAIEKHELPIQLFHDLLTAFKQDVTKKRYASFEEVLEYCRYSANPVGRLLLYLMNAATVENLKQSDAICSALQVINFLQDIEQDYVENNRIYLPQDEMQRLGVNEEHIKCKICDDALRSLIDAQIQHVKKLMLEGAPLGRNLTGRFGFQLRIMINGGWRILQLLDLHKEKCFSRPRLRKIDWLQISWNALMKKNLEIQVIG